MFLLFAAASLVDAAPPSPIFDYIRRTWKTLTRTNRNLPASAVDTKSHATGPWPVYVPSDEDPQVIEQKLRADAGPEGLHDIVLRSLPQNLSEIRQHGLLYLPEPYVVPGGRFNEMYGWDSYFIQLGLLRDGELTLAKNLTDNFLYEVVKYGKVLNANRSYYLTRSQPPFLTEMVLNVYRRTHDDAWIESSLRAIQTYYEYWNTAPHLTPETGLSRYFDTGQGPAPEVLAGEPSYYETARDYYKKRAVSDYDVSQYYDREKDQLTALFYTGDRSMRESGFDPSNRFGPFNVDIIHYNPVCLNSLLYLMETQIAEMFDILHREAEAKPWRERAARRATTMNELLWDEKDGLYYDYDFINGHRRPYPFLTSFFPLWAGLAKPEQAARVAHNLPMFERPGGLETSILVSGEQWDAPFGWAPLELIAIRGLRRYGYREEADRISLKFLSLVQQEFRRTGTLSEKYDVVKRASNLRGEIRFGYRTNEAGFGWTNAVFTALYDDLSPEQRSKLN